MPWHKNLLKRLLRMLPVSTMAGMRAADCQVCLKLFLPGTRNLANDAQVSPFILYLYFTQRKCLLVVYHTTVKTFDGAAGASKALGRAAACVQLLLLVQPQYLLATR